MGLDLTLRDKAQDWLCGAMSPFTAGVSPPPSDELWPEIVRLADSWLIAPRLYERYRNTTIIPSDAAEVLEAVFEYSVLRAESMRAELSAIIEALNQAGVEPVIFKGAEWLMGHYAPHAHRLISDLDLWLPGDRDQQAAMETLQSIGYRPKSPLDTHVKAQNHHFPPFHKGGAVARVELHHRLIRASLTQSMDLKRASERLVRCEQGGLRYRRLSPLDGVTVAFLQSGRMAAPNFSTRRVAVAKWLDLMDRHLALGGKRIASPAELGILDGPDQTDIQLLTALASKFDFPYDGPSDTSYIDEWAKPSPVYSRFVQEIWSALTWKRLSSPSSWARFVKRLPRSLRALAVSRMLR